MRRKDREMSEEFAWAVTDTCRYAVMTMVTAQGQPYGVPLSMVREERHLYFHAAMEGFKTDCLRAHPEVCVVCVGDTRPLTDTFTTLYESAILRGCAVEVTEPAEKIHALRLLCLRYTPTNMPAFDAAIAKSLERTAVWRVDIDEISGKAKR